MTAKCGRLQGNGMMEMVKVVMQAYWNGFVMIDGCVLLPCS